MSKIPKWFERWFDKNWGSSDNSLWIAWKAYNKGKHVAKKRMSHE